MGLWLGAHVAMKQAFWIWLSLSGVMVALLWAMETFRLIRQIVGCRSLTGLAVIALQHLPLLQTQLVNVLLSSIFFLLSFAFMAFLVK
jgi:hypothetical protein